jgi:putative acyl-CoA dehydrogenase
MVYRNPRTQLETHKVTNQPPPFENVNLFETDQALRRGVRDGDAAEFEGTISDFAARCGSEDVAEWATQANRNPPVLKAFDRYGERIDEVEFHPAYHSLMALGLGAGIAGVAWTSAKVGHACMPRSNS